MVPSTGVEPAAAISTAPIAHTCWQSRRLNRNELTVMCNLIGQELPTYEVRLGQRSGHLQSHRGKG
jgi:hypothetical protein